MHELRPEQFERVVAIARDRWGLNLTLRKLPLVSNRLASHVRKLRFSSIDEYLEYISESATEEDLLAFFDVLSTNVTSFFRDRPHFDYLERELWTGLSKGNITLPSRKIRLWSAGCSIGAEPYSMAIHVHEHLSDLGSWDVKILATDLSTSVVEHARQGVYEAEQLEGLEPELRRRHFTKVDKGDRYAVKDHLRAMVGVARMNLFDPWPIRGPFDVIFCRNVMIYFDVPERKQLVNRFHQLLRPGGIFAVGSAETLSGLDTPFRSVQASVYVK